MKHFFITIAAVLMSVTIFAQETPGFYELKSGILNKATSINGTPVQITVYFDDYGHKFAEYTYYTFYKDGAEQNILFTGKIMSDGQEYSVSYTRHQKKAIYKESEIINFLNLTDDFVDKYKIKKAKKQEEICGKMCDIYSY